MSRLLWEAGLLALAALLSWWLLVRPPQTETPDAGPAEIPPILLTPSEELATTVQEIQVQAPPEPEPETESESAPEPPPQPEEAETVESPASSEEPAPPPPEAGNPDSEREQNAAGEVESETEDLPEPEQPEAQPEEPAAPKPEEAVAAAMADPDLLAQAGRELAGQSGKGFQTVFLAKAEDQLDIARFFGEELVMVPKTYLNPEAPSQSFRLNLADNRVEPYPGRPPLQQFRQYRDLFAYPFDQLPAPIRDLRLKVIARKEVFLFGALISHREWALVIQRRSEALAESPHPNKAVRRYELRYRRLSGGAFDLEVQEIEFADGSRYRPAPRGSHRP
ncbi:MAG: hypothetical protein DWQ01_09600 [Planctomycetota bacterium]|nr:MAG: hypothetical protein DWQ01_09600 [Planctomycetota bacterium]